MTSSPVRALAFYLPQYHPTPENDAWWGPGFTEWTNVARARPQFRGHYQPHIPRDLGFYDLRLRETRLAQASAVKSAGLEALCYYHYWFNGRRLLGHPLDAMLASDEPDLPFCLCWANEDWTRAWDGRSGEYLVRQHYSVHDDEEHMRWLLRVFEDPRYVRVNGRPLLLVYRVELLPDPARTAELWRRSATDAGEQEPYLCNVQSFVNANPADYGFDAAVEFQPDWSNLPRPYRSARLPETISTRAAMRKGLEIYSYDEHVQKAQCSGGVPYLRFPCVMPSWDNSARRGGGGLVFHESCPETYERWLESAVSVARQLPAGERLLFINAWNEWGEGNHLEPCLRWQTGYIETTARALAK